MKKLSHLIQYAFLRIIGAILAFLPPPLFYSFARGFAYFIYYIVPIRKQVAKENIFQALGNERTAEEIQRICRESYVNIGYTMLEMLIAPRQLNKIRSMVAMVDMEILQKNMEKNRGVILASAHFGSWELAGAAVAAAGIPATGVGAQQSNPYIDRYITQYRTKLGLTVLRPYHSSVKPLVRALKDNGVIGLISDQDSGESGVFVIFFGRLASTPVGTAQLALKFKTPILVALAIRAHPGKYQLRFREVEITDDDTVQTLTQKYTTIIEEFIRKNPEQYFWMHRRWKTTAPLP